MANNTLNTRIILCNDTSLNWSTSEKVLLKGELGIELTDGVPKVKIGDGVNKYVDLAYVTMTPAEITAAISAAVEGANTLTTIRTFWMLPPHLLLPPY